MLVADEYKIKVMAVGMSRSILRQLPAKMVGAMPYAESRAFVPMLWLQGEAVHKDYQNRKVVLGTLHGKPILVVHQHTPLDSEQCLVWMEHRIPFAVVK